MREQGKQDTDQEGEVEGVTCTEKEPAESCKEDKIRMEEEERTAKEKADKEEQDQRNIEAEKKDEEERQREEELTRQAKEQERKKEEEEVKKKEEAERAKREKEEQERIKLDEEAQKRKQEEEERLEEVEKFKREEEEHKKIEEETTHSEEKQPERVEEQETAVSYNSENIQGEIMSALSKQEQLKPEQTELDQEGYKIFEADSEEGNKEVSEQQAEVEEGRLKLQEAEQRQNDEESKTVAEEKQKVEEDERQRLKQEEEEKERKLGEVEETRKREEDKQILREEEERKEREKLERRKAKDDEEEQIRMEEEQIWRERERERERESAERKTEREKESEQAKERKSLEKMQLEQFDRGVKQDLRTSGTAQSARSDDTRSRGQFKYCMTTSHVTLQPAAAVPAPTEPAPMSVFVIKEALPAIQMFGEYSLRCVYSPNPAFREKGLQLIRQRLLEPFTALPADVVAACSFVVSRMITDAEPYVYLQVMSLFEILLGVFLPKVSGRHAPFLSTWLGVITAMVRKLSDSNKKTCNATMQSLLFVAHILGHQFVVNEIAHPPARVSSVSGGVPRCLVNRLLLLKLFTSEFHLDYSDALAQFIVLCLQHPDSEVRRQATDALLLLHRLDPWRVETITAALPLSPRLAAAVRATLEESGAAFEVPAEADAVAERANLTAKKPAAEPYKATTPPRMPSSAHHRRSGSAGDGASPPSRHILATPPFLPVAAPPSKEPPDEFHLPRILAGRRANTVGTPATDNDGSRVQPVLQAFTSLPQTPVSLSQRQHPTTR
eukprot:TRINITY_DN1050_c1_g2_i3.p1 TRINITY_DN1050_c1_g2~~TRINITY_DN1050_c1_g2_i3.p1  ORF type:complete len:783 (+),score=230.92 TRINITY_DN1050_c1_g2_i3:1650-3998(+)